MCSPPCHSARVKWPWRRPPESHLNPRWLTVHALRLLSYSLEVRMSTAPDTFVRRRISPGQPEMPSACTTHHLVQACTRTDPQRGKAESGRDSLHGVGR